MTLTVGQGLPEAKKYKKIHETKTIHYYGMSVFFSDFENNPERMILDDEKQRDQFVTNLDSLGQRPAHIWVKHTASQHMKAGTYKLC